MEINEKMLREFREDFKSVVKSLEEKYGIELKLENMRYNDVGFSGKFSALVAGNPFAQYEKTYNSLHNFYDLPDGLLGMTFPGNGKTLKFVGIDRSKRNYPCICTGSDGRQYKLSVDQLKRHIK